MDLHLTPQQRLWAIGGLGAAAIGVLVLFLARTTTFLATVRWSGELPDGVQGAVAGISSIGMYALAGIFMVAALSVWTTGARLPGESEPSRASGLVLAAVTGTGVVLAYGISSGVKALVAQARPCQDLAVTTIAECPVPTSFSWPSNHSTIAVALAVGVWVMSKRWAPLALLAVPLGIGVALSRVFVGVHFFHDVLAGALLGAVVVWAAARWLAPIVRRLVTRTGLAARTRLVTRTGVDGG